MRDTEKTEGLIAAPLTGFHPDGSVNLDVIPEYANMLHADGVVGAFVNGTTGEGLSLTTAERKATAEQWVKSAPDGFKVIIHVTHTSQVEAEELASHAAEIGATAIGLMGPIFFTPPDVETLIEYVAAIAARVPDLPCYYYHIPSMSGVSFPVIDILEAADGIIRNLAGVKYTCEDFMDFDLCRQFKGGKYDMLFGRDEILLCALALGTRGAIGSTYNFAAPLSMGVIEAFDGGDIVKARQLQRMTMNVVRMLRATDCFLSAAKAIMKMLGLDLGGVRLPQVAISPEVAAKLKDELTDSGFFDLCNKS